MDENRNLNKEDKKTYTAWWLPAVKIFIKLSGWIVFPVIIALFVGKWLDSKFNTSPWLLFLSIIIAFVVSMVVLGISASREMKKMDEKK
jgi:F0F1-type ATP synthase assembly protein I